jgi:hypothetical protein
MNNNKNNFVGYRILAGVLLLAAIAGIGWFAYQAGLNSTQAAAVQLPAVENGMPYYPHFFFHPLMTFFGVIIVLCLVGFAFRSMRFMLWGPRWYGRRFDRFSWRHHRHWDGEGVPPMVEEWHRRMHGESPDKQDKA